MKYANLINNTVNEIIPDFDPIFPNIPIEQRFSAAFCKELREIPAEQEGQVCPGWTYNADTDVFEEPVPQEPETATSEAETSSGE